MRHLPRPRLIAVGAGGQCAHRANINAHSTLFALQMVLAIGCDGGSDAAVLHAQRPNVHGLAADAHAAIAENAARAIEENYGRPLLLLAMLLELHVARFGGAVSEGHVLELTLTAGIAYRAIERMIAEQQLQHGL